MPRVRYLLYARKSEEDKNRQVQSIGDQIKELRDLALRRNLNIVSEIREEHSAKAPGRPQFNQMLDAIRRHEADGILVWSINRLLRNPVDHGTISWMLQQGEIASIATMDKEYLPGDNVVLLSVESAVANQFIIDLRKGTLRGIASKVEKGWFPHKAPVGYQNNLLDKTIEPDPARFPLLKHAWRMLLSENKSVPQILDMLNDELGFRTPKGQGGQRGAGERPLARNTLYRMFANIFYAGYFVHNGKIHKGMHEPMVSLDELARAKRILNRPLKVRGQKHSFPFTGLIRCARCGGSVTAEKHTKTIRTSGQERTYTYYRCANLHGRCDKRGINESALVAQIDELLGHLTIPQEFKEWGLRELERWKVEDETVRQVSYEQKQSELVALNRQLDTLLELRLKEVIGDEDYLRKREEMTLARDALHQQVENLEQSGDETRQIIENVLMFCSQARAWFGTGDFDVQRLVAGALGIKYEFDGKAVRIDPHPLLVPILKADFTVPRPTFQVRSDEENDDFEPVKSGFQTWKEDGSQEASFIWGRTWDYLRTEIELQNPYTKSRLDDKQENHNNRNEAWIQRFETLKLALDQGHLKVNASFHLAQTTA